MDPSPPNSIATPAEQKAALRREVRARRSAEVAALPKSISALILSRPAAPVVSLVPEGATIALYAPHRDEAPAFGYAKWFHERGHRIVLPWFADRKASMAFREWGNPYDESLLETGPFGILQPMASAPEIVPEILFVPLVAFTADGERLGQGGGHYDRWLAGNPAAVAIGLAWDSQLVESIPGEDHDHQLKAVVTPTRFYKGSE